jgi:hypothetical protein
MHPTTTKFEDQHPIVLRVKVTEVHFWCHHRPLCPFLVVNNAQVLGVEVAVTFLINKNKINCSLSHLMIMFWFRYNKLIGKELNQKKMFFNGKTNNKNYICQFRNSRWGG